MNKIDILKWFIGLKYSANQIRNYKKLKNLPTIDDMDQTIDCLSFHLEAIGRRAVEINDRDLLYHLFMCGIVKKD